MRITPFGASQRRRDELSEQRVWPVWPTFELWVALRANPERVPGQFDELDKAVVRRCARADEACLLEASAIRRVELPPVTMTFLSANFMAVRLRGSSLGLWATGPVGSTWWRHSTVQRLAEAARDQGQHLAGR